MDTHNSMVTVRGKGVWGAVGEGEDRISGDGRALDFGGEHTIQYTMMY